MALGCLGLRHEKRRTDNGCQCQNKHEFLHIMHDLNRFLSSPYGATGDWVYRRHLTAAGYKFHGFTE
jgi:hypothetical protein